MLCENEAVTSHAPDIPQVIIKELTKVIFSQNLHGKVLDSKSVIGFNIRRSIRKYLHLKRKENPAFGNVCNL
jgi:hypothetical protein